MGKQDRRRDQRRKAAPRPKAEAPASPEATPAPALRQYISRPWFAPALFALVALVYFWEFPSQRQDHLRPRRGARLPPRQGAGGGEAARPRAPGLVAHHGRLPRLRGDPPQVLPHLPHRAVHHPPAHRRLALHPRRLRRRLRHVPLPAAGRRPPLGRPLGRPRLPLGAHLPQLPVRRPLRQDVGHRPLPLPPPLRGARHGRRPAGPRLVGRPPRPHRHRHLHPPLADDAVRPPGHRRLYHL